MNTSRIPAFIAQARQLIATAEQARWTWQDTKRKVKALCDAEITWIYRVESAEYGPKNLINRHYRTALKSAGLEAYFVSMPLAMYEADMGDRIDQRNNTVRGYFCEPVEALHVRMNTDTAKLETSLVYQRDVSSLEQCAPLYLQRAVGFCESDDILENYVGLLMGTGRRTQEIGQTATMTPLKPYHVAYTGQLKTRSQTRAEALIPIPVLVPNGLICAKLVAVQDWVGSQLCGTAVFHDTVGRKVRDVVNVLLCDLFPEKRRVSPRALRNNYVALTLECRMPNGEALFTGDPERFLASILGHKWQPSATDHYKSHVMPRLSRGIVLPH